MKYIVSDAARRDIKQILRHIRLVQKSSQNAALVAVRLDAQFRRLARMPGMGHRRQDVEDPQVLGMMVSGLLVLYDPSDKPLLILRVVQRSRNVEAIKVR